MSPAGCRSGDAEPGSLKAVNDLVDIAGQMKASTVVIAGGHRTDDLRLVESARDHGIIDRIVLVGSGASISKAVEEVGIHIERKDILSADGDEAMAGATVDLVRSGGIDIVLKGGISTPVINRYMLSLAVRPTVSLATLFDAAPIADGRPLLLTDAGVTTLCNFGRMVDLISNAVEVGQVVMGIERPRVAILSANEKQIASLPSTWLGRKLAERSWPNAVVYGPLSFDLATDSGSVAVKGLPDLPGARDVAGNADILVCPGIDAANILYKTITAMTKFGQASLAGITVGFSVPYVILSRADNLETRLLSIALCSIYAQRTSGDKKKKKSTIKQKQVKTYRVLTINPGSTSIKIAMYENQQLLHEKEEPYMVPSLAKPEVFQAQVEEVSKLVCRVLDQWKESGFDAIAARGGFLKRPPGKLSGGTYVIAELREDRIVIDRNIFSSISSCPESDHASNLGIPVACALAERFRVPAYTVDPVVVDEFIPEAEISGYAPVDRRSTSHALSVRAAAKKAADLIGRPVEDINLVVAHLGGGITVTSVKKGKMIDNNIALLGGGPFTPQRAGTLPAYALIDLCYSGKFSRDLLIEELTKHGGIRSYLGEHRMEIIEKRIAEGDRQARSIVDALVYQIAKEIGGMFVAAGCDVEAIILTGGLVRSTLITQSLRKRVLKLAPVLIFEEPLEMAALASGAVEVLSGRVKSLRYCKIKPGN
jgi:butyrate kinase